MEVMSFSTSLASMRVVPSLCLADDEYNRRVDNRLRLELVRAAEGASSISRFLSSLLFSRF